MVEEHTRPGGVVGLGGRDVYVQARRPLSTLEMNMAQITERTVADKLQALEEWKQRSPKPESVQAKIDTLAEFPADMALLELHEAVNWSTLTPVEQAAIRWQRRQDLGNGGFWVALWEALTVADEVNLTLLASAYPVEVEAIRRWREDRAFVNRLRGLPFRFSL